MKIEPRMQIFTLLLAYLWWFGYSFQLNSKLVVRQRVIVNCKDTATRGLLFDCDGVIVETEEFHRIAYNKAFDWLGLRLSNGEKVVWSVEYYDRLQNSVGGGKPKMRQYFNIEVKCWPSTMRPYKAAPQTARDKDKLIDRLQDVKNKFYLEQLSDSAQTRPGVLQLMDAAFADPDVKVGVCSASTKDCVIHLLDKVLGADRMSQLSVLLAGDDVPLKKPNPMIYTLAAEKLNIPADRCIVIEDSLIGLKAAKAAQMRCVVTYTESTKSQNFTEDAADLVLPDLQYVSFGDIKALTK